MLARVARRASAALVAANVLAAAAPHTATADTVLAGDASKGVIAAHGQTVAWSRWDPTISAYRLVVRRRGRTAELPVAPSPQPFDVSAGPGPDGSTWLVWGRCDPLDCDVVRYDLDDPGERPVPAAALAGVSESAPSIDRRRIAFARVRRSGTERQITFAIAPTAGGRARSVDAVPATTCAVGLSDGCGRRPLRSVDSLALRGDALLVASGVEAGIGICGFSTVRYVNLRNRDARQIDSAVCGLSGASFDSVTFDDRGRAWYVKVCPGDSDPCLGPRSGPFRYDPSTGRTQRLAMPFGSQLRAVALADGRTPIVKAAAPRRPRPATCEPMPMTLDPNEQCQVVTTIAPQRYEDAPRRASDVPPPGYRSLAAKRGLGLLRPPGELPCTVANPAPLQRPVLWAGARAVDDRGRQRRFPSIPVTATSGGRSVRGRIAAQTRDVEAWAFTRLVLGGRAACGRSWTLTYRPPGRQPTRYRVRVLLP